MFMNTNKPHNNAIIIEKLKNILDLELNEPHVYAYKTLYGMHSLIYQFNGVFSSKKIFFDYMDYI